MILTYKNQKIEIDEVDVIHGTPIIYDATYIDTGKKLTDAEMDELQSACELEIVEQVASFAGMMRYDKSKKD